jgi:hypothetical protein
MVAFLAARCRLRLRSQAARRRTRMPTMPLNAARPCEGKLQHHSAELTSGDRELEAQETGEPEGQSDDGEVEG